VCLSLTRRPFTPKLGVPFSVDVAGKTRANAAFFILRNGQPAKQFIADWWGYPGVEGFAFKPWFEQVALSLMWPYRGCVVLNGSAAGEWAHMSDASIDHSTTPTTHIESARGRRRLMYMQAALLALTLKDARRGRDAEACAGRGAESRVIAIDLGVNESVDLRGPPTISVLREERR
jgi:hypothetical protein